MPATIIASWFSDPVGIYDTVGIDQVDNNGGWDDTGVVLGASLVFGGGAHSGRVAGSRG